MFKCLNAQMFKSSNDQMFKCSNVHMSNVEYQVSNINEVKLLSELTSGHFDLFKRKSGACNGKSKRRNVEAVWV